MSYGALDKSVLLFIQSQSVLTIATCKDNIPSSATCFYAFLEIYNLLIFKSNRETKHISEALQNSHVAGTIVPDKSEVGKIKGIQFTGSFIEPNKELLEESKTAYYKKYPFAIAFKGDIWAIELTALKFTDNTLGFGKKLQWEKQVALSERNS
jgi:uncharacterized protein